MSDGGVSQGSFADVSRAIGKAEVVIASQMSVVVDVRGVVGGVISQMSVVRGVDTVVVVSVVAVAGDVEGGGW